MNIFLFLLTLGLGIAALFTKARWLYSPWRFVVLTGILAPLLLATVLSVRKDSAQEQVWQPGALTFTAPIDVAANPNDYPDGLDGTLDQAISHWNSEIGCTVLRRVATDAPMIDAKIHPVDGTECGLPQRDPFNKVMYEVSVYCWAGWVDTQTTNLDLPGVAYVAFLHELGHIMGLGHDLSGVMAKTVPGSLTVQSTWISDKDLVALRGRYCR